MHEKIYTGFDDGLICSYSVKAALDCMKGTDSGSSFLGPLIGHSNRVNQIMATDKNYLLSLSNDCTIRKWDYETGINESIFKFCNPVEVGLLNKS